MAVAVESSSVDLSDFAQTIYHQKSYSHELPDGSREQWEDTAARVTHHVLDTLGYGPDSYEYTRTYELIRDRKFIPGGRYLYATGRELHQTQNCVLFRAEDSREGWANLAHRCAMSLMTGAGVGVVYSDLREKGAFIKKTGGVASGPLSLMQMINEMGRHIMQGGTRRSAIWAGLHWNHPDVFEFIRMKPFPDSRAPRTTLHDVTTHLIDHLHEREGA